MRKPIKIATQGGYSIEVVGAQSTPLRDFYHALLRLPWPASFGTLGGGFLVANVLFALAYLATGGIAHAEPGSFWDAFYFSVQTMGTIGYGAMYPASGAANALVVAESLVGLIVTAAATGLVFAKLSRPTARIVFTNEVVISPIDGVPTLSLRIGNERGNQIVGATFRAVLTRTEKTGEGHSYYRIYDLKLRRDHALTLSRSFTLFHAIDETSPLWGRNALSLEAEEAELQFLIIGLDDTTMQTVHAGKSYPASKILWGVRHADVIRETDEGFVLDLTKFHDVEPLTERVQ